MEVRMPCPVEAVPDIHRAPDPRYSNNPAPSHSHGLIRYVRPVLPASFTITLERYSLLSYMLSGDGQFYASATFEDGGYDWKLYVYPGGKNAEGYISLYLALADEGIDHLPKGWEAYVSLKMFVLNQFEDNFLTVEDDHQGLVRFHEDKTVHGYSHFISHQTFNDGSNGYLVHDRCTFGVEILFLDRGAVKSECCKENSSQFPQMKFQIDCPSFSKQTQYSKHCFVTAGGKDWKITLFPKGMDRSQAYISFEVKLADDDGGDVAMPSLETKPVNDAAKSSWKERSIDNATTALKKLKQWFPLFNVAYKKLSQWLPTFNVWSKPIELERAIQLLISFCIKTESHSSNQEVERQRYLTVKDTTSSEESTRLFLDFMPLSDLLDESKHFLVDDNLRIYVTIDTMLIKKRRR